MTIAAGAFEPFYLRIFFADRGRIAANEIELPYRKLPGSRAFLLEVRARTRPGDVVAIAAPFPESHPAYEYLYSRSLYPLAGRAVVPESRAAEANVIAAYRCEWRTDNLVCPGQAGLPVLHNVSLVWRGQDGVLLRRAP